jgi:hypothetical protein
MSIMALTNRMSNEAQEKGAVAINAKDENPVRHRKKEPTEPRMQDLLVSHSAQRITNFSATVHLFGTSYVDF